MNYKKMEYLLYNYKNFKAEIKNIELEIEQIKNNYDGLSAIIYDDMPKAKNNFNSAVENEVQRKDERIARLQDLILQKENIIERIDNALDVLQGYEKDLITECYFNNKLGKDVAIELDVTEQTICRNKNKIIKKLEKLIFIE